MSTATDETRRWRRVAGWVATGLACVLVLFALIVPNDVNRLTLGSFLRIPVEGLVGVVLALVLPVRARRIVAAGFGLILGLLLLVKFLDMGFLEVLSRPFDLVLDWSFVAAGVDFVAVTDGRAAAIGAVVGAVLLVIAVLVLMTLSAVRLSRLVAERRTVATRAVVAVALVWILCAVLGLRLVPGLPVASTSAAVLTYQHVRQVPEGIRDAQRFEVEAAVDGFRDRPGSELLTALRGKDVVVSFVESYGRSAIENPEFAPQVNAVLDAGSAKLRAAGFASRSAFLTSPTVGGGSWLAHSTLYSGLWIDNQQRYRNLVVSDRFTLTSAFRRANWRSVGVEPAVTRAYPEGEFFGYNQIYVAGDLGYRGPRFAYATMPDQYTLSAFQRSERAPDHAPVMAGITLLSSHAPWTSIPRLIDWNEVGDGSVFYTPDSADKPTDGSQERTDYRRSIEYSLQSLISYVETYGDQNLVLIFLGDHQPAPLITGEGASRDVPITIVARDPAVLDRISGWSWQDGLRPDPHAPVWRMNEFRDRFLTAFGPR